MVSVTADDARLLKDVRLFVEPVEVYDAKGKLLGLFVPANLERGKQMRAKVIAETDWAEIERRIDFNEKGASHEEVWCRIRQLEAEIQRRQTAGEKDFTTEEALAYYRSLWPEAKLPPPVPLAEAPLEAGPCATR